MASTEITEEDVAALVERWSQAAQLYMDADPLVRPVSLELFAAISRGEHAV